MGESSGFGAFLRVRIEVLYSREKAPNYRKMGIFNFRGLIRGAGAGN